MTPRLADLRPAPLRRSMIAAGLVVSVVAGAGFAQAAWAERVLVLEATAPGVWRTKARRMTVEFRRTGAATDPRLMIRFIDANGDAVSPRTAQRVGLSAAGETIIFRRNGRAWISTSAQSAPREGARLSIVEADHQHDFLLNVSKPASAVAHR